MTITELIRLRWPLMLAGLVFMLGLWTAATADQVWLRKGPDMDGFQQIILRGTISSIDRPEFKSAAQARIPDSVWNLGYEMDGLAYAYDLIS